MTTTIDEATRERLREALTSPDLHIVAGLGTGDGGTGHGRRCTMAEINLILTGRLSDRPNPCVSEAIRRWVIRVQDAMPDDIRNSAAWREAAVGIAGSERGPDAEAQRAALLLEWMWERLGDESVLAAIPASARPAWDAMLTKRTRESARVANAAANAAYANAAYANAAYDAYAYAANAAAAYAADYAYAAANAATHAVAHAAAHDHAAYWQRADCPGMLAKLVAIGACRP